MYNYNIHNINSILDTTYNIREYKNDSLTYSNSILDKLECLQIKNDIDNLCKNIIKFYKLINTCADILGLIESKCNNIIPILSYQTKFYRKIKYIYNVYNFILKYKLYMQPKFGNTVKFKSRKLREELKSYDNHNHNDTKKNRKILKNIIILQELITKVNSFINDDNNDDNNDDHN